MENIWRADFPILEQKVYGKPLIYLDNAATTQMPYQVMDCLKKHYSCEHANVHRGIHFLSEQSTSAVERARDRVRAFLHAQFSEEIIFTQGTTDSIHLVSSGIRHCLNEKNGILVTQLEHHSNFVPWQQVCAQTGASFHVCPAPDGDLDMEVFEKILSEEHIFLVAVTQVSNLTGTVTPLGEIIRLAHLYGAQVLVDGAQGIRHTAVDVGKLDCDFYCFSGHKILAPTGVGVLYGKRSCLEQLLPCRFGGGMVDVVTDQHTTWAPLPHKLEAGTPNISGIIGLGEAISYLQLHEIEKIYEYEIDLLKYLLKELEKIEMIHILGHPKERAGVISFCVEDLHPYDIASLLDKAGIAVRSGSHCAQPALHSLGVDAAVRVSPAFYNTKEEIDVFCEYLKKIVVMLLKWKKRNNSNH
ncbi:MAG: aminotransferase class V-fold PLP-dependent enzyme [Agathobacter sp.]